MDQIVFIFDLESFLPPSVEVEEDVEFLLEKGLQAVKEAALKILTHGRVLERRADLSSFGFRFYSSSGYFSVDRTVTGDWHELSLSSWELLEDQLRERFDSVLSALQRTEPGTRLRGRLSPAAAACKALDEVTVLYSWDRPALFSPIKSVRKTDLRFGNAVFLVTSLPDTLDDLQLFLGGSKTNINIKPRHVAENLLSKRTASHFTGELNISLHILNTRSRQHDDRIVQVFDKALKEVKGGVVQLSSLSSQSVRRLSPGSEVLQCSSWVAGPLPTTALLSSHLATSGLPARVLERNFYTETSICLNNNTRIRLEMRAGASSPPELTPVCFVKTSTFQPDQLWARTSLAWSKLPDDLQLATILSVLRHSGRCLLLEDQESLVVVLFYNTDSTATLGFLDKVESSFYQQIFSRKFSVPKVSQEIADIVEGVEPVKLVRPKHKSQPPPGVPFDGSSLERWRIPDEPVAGFLQTCQVPSSQNEIHKKLMLSVRESYVARTGMPEQGVRKLAKKPSALSNASTTSATSSGGQVRRTGRSGKSRGEMLKDLSVLNRSSAVLDTEGTVKKEEATGENEMLEEKTQSAEAMMMKMGSPNVATDLLIDRLVEIQGRVISSGEDVELAGYSEACISFLLKHLDTTGVNKSSLEEVVTARLLADVATVARNSKNDLALRVSQHKVQVLLMAEVHWLLANQESQEEYEESILAHMRQMSLHGGQELMTDFLSGPLTQFYVVRQPDLLCLLYDELELQRPSNLNLCSPATSLQPNSVKSISSLGPSSASSMQPPAILVNKPKVNLSRSFRSRPKSFDTSLTSRQIDLSVAGRRVKKSTKLVTTGRMVSSKLRVSGKKKLAGAKSPKKTKQMVKRNLNFDGSGKSPDRGKSPRKNISVTTPSKARKYQSSRSLRTPGKTHKILCPETPASKVRRRKSDGNTSVAETPEKTEESLTPRRQQASMAVRRRASFYPGNVPSSLTTTSQLNLSLANTTTLDMTSVLDESQMGLNKSLVLFPHLHNRKRKREDSFEDPADEEEGKSPLRKARKRLNSFSEQLSSLAKPFESTHLFSTAQLGQHLGQHIEQHLGDKLNISSIPNLHTTPVKRLSGADFFSPSKKVHFNMKPQPPTPKSGLKAKSILKTPGKESPVTKTTFKTPVKTPSKVAVKLMQSPAPLRLADTPPSSSSCRPLTPVRVTPRKNLGQGSSKTLCLTEPGETLLTPVKTTRSASPSSPIFSSSKKRRRLSIGARVSEESQSPGLKVPSSQDHFLPPLMSTLQPAGDGVSKKIPTAFNPGLVSTKIDLHLTASRSATMTTQDIINSTSLPSLSSTVIKPSSHLQSDIFENSALVPPAMAATLKTEFVLPVVEGATTPETTPTKCLELTPVKAGGLEEEEELELLSPLKGSGKAPRRISLAPPSPRPLSKKSRRSVRSVFYKEYESEESQTDDEEYMRIVEERFGDGQKTEDGHDNNDNKAKKPASKIVVRSPVRFKCKFCGGGFRTRKSLLAHEAEELESQKLRSQEQTSDDEFSHEAEVSLGKKTIDCEEEKEEERGVKKAPKMISSLQDQLSSYFSPSSSSGRARRNTDRLSDVYSLAQLTPRSSRPSNRALARTRTVERGATSTPNDSQNISRTQRTSRARNVSYAEFPDFDSTDSDVSLCEDGPRRTLANKMVVSTRPSVSPLLSFNSGKALVVKNLNDSQEIEDLTDRIRSRDVSPLATPEKTDEIWSGDTSLASPGKYFSVGQITETPTGQIKLRINRTSKPQQSTPLVSDQPRTKQTNRKKAEPLWLPKMSRSACREMGMSPGRLVSIMTSKTPPKPPAVTEKTPEKENLPHAVGKLREDNGINKTPRIRIKKISSINPSSSSNWQAETIVSPEKAVRESPVRSFTPLSSSSLHKLTTSPIINTEVFEKHKKERKKKVHKQLSYV